MKESSSPGPAADRPISGRVSARFAVLLWLVYAANLNTLGSGDTTAATLVPVALLHGDGVYLDRFERLITDDQGLLEGDFTRWHGHIVPLYPLAPGVLLTPLHAPQVGLMDLWKPGWEQSRSALSDLAFLAKNSVAMLTALIGVLLLQLLVSLGVGRCAAWSATLAACLGSSLWTTASQAPWQHGPAALAIALTSVLLSPRELPRWRAMLAGGAAGLLVASRAMDVVFALAALGWVAWNHPRRLAAFGLPMVPIVGLPIAFNLHVFGSPLGGMAVLESLHPKLHATAGTWTGNLWEGAAGTLWSPSRGLFVFSPWTLLAVLCIPGMLRRLPRGHVVVWFLAAMVPFGLILSKYSVWWGGYCFGPRYWTEAIPILAVPLAFGLDGAFRRGRLALVPFVLAIAWSVGVQAIGAACFPSTWCSKPTSIDWHHERLWDWRDSELSRCLAEGPNFRLRRIFVRMGVLPKKPVPTNRRAFDTIQPREERGGEFIGLESGGNERVRSLGQSDRLHAWTNSVGRRSDPAPAGS